MKTLLIIATLLAALSLHAAKNERSTVVAEWRNVHSAEIPRELRLLIDSRECRRAARAELGDAGLFERFAWLLKKHFVHYDRNTVNAALRHMKPLVPAVDPVRAATDLTHIRSRVELAADKDPEMWRPVLETIDDMRNKLIAQYH